MSSLADRIKIASKGKGREVIPSVQEIINCGDAGNCQGGDPNAANAWVHKSGGVPDVTCQQYQGKNMNCTAEARCQNCAGANCYGVPVNLIPMIQVEEYGSVTGDDKIRAEIFARGPVSCTIDASVLGWVLPSGNTGYTSGIANYTTTPRLDHAIQIAGWGVEDGVEYWLGRNSWGTYVHSNYRLRWLIWSRTCLYCTADAKIINDLYLIVLCRYWGEHGWFRIARKPNSAAATVAARNLVPYEPGTCYWATPKYPGTGPGGKEL
jgi:hypothetical protein